MFECVFNLDSVMSGQLLQARLTSRHNRNRNSQSRFGLLQLFILLLRRSVAHGEGESEGGRDGEEGSRERARRRGDIGDS